MKLALRFALLATAPPPLGSVQTPPQEQTIVRAGSQPSTQGPEQYFTGKVRVDPVFAARADVPYGAADATFEPGARSAWHMHPAGQRLIVTAGGAGPASGAGRSSRSRPATPSGALQVSSTGMARCRARR